MKNSVPFSCCTNAEVTVAKELQVTKVPETPEEPEISSSGPRIIVISCDIDEEIIGEIMGRLAELNEDSHAPIRLQIFSGGGSLHAGWALYDLLTTSPSPIVTEAYGYAGSAAATIFEGGVLRLLSPNATLMIHQTQRMVCEGTMLTIKELRTMAAEMTAHQSVIERMLARRTKQPIAKIREWCAEEKEFTAVEALKFGFADHILPANRPVLLAQTTGKKRFRARAKK
jgi:ATP-dependent Clp protease protease subunit